MNKGILAVLFVLVLLVACREEEGAISVTGHIHDGKKPMADVKVDLDGLVQYEATTDINGKFTINNVSPGLHELNMTKTLSDGAFSVRKETIEVAESIELSSLLLPTPVQLSEPVVASGFYEDHVTLNWTKYSGADFREYKVYRHPTPGLDETTGELIYVSTSSADTTFEITQAHSSKMYFRVFVLDETSLLAGSNLVNATTSAYVNPNFVDLGKEVPFYLNAGEVIWVKFPAEKGEIYKIAWYDEMLSYTFPNVPGYHTFGNYTANVHVSAYRADRATPYFPATRVMQMDGSPMPIAALDNEDVYIKVTGAANADVGSFGLRVDKLNKATARQVVVDDQSITVPLDQGEMKLLYFDAVEAANYSVSSISTIKSVCCGDGILMHISAYSENTGTSYLYRKNVALKNGDTPAIDNFTSTASERIYLVVDGSYWFIANSAVIRVMTN